MTDVHFYYLREDERSWYFMNVQSEDVIQRPKFSGAEFPIAYVDGGDTRILHGVEDGQVTEVHIVEGKQSEGGEPAPAEEGNPDGDSCEWTDDMCLLLISEYQELRAKVGSLRVPSCRKMWGLMEATFQQKGYLLKRRQLEIKWKTMQRAYKNAQKTKSKAGRGRKNCPFEKELHEILAPRRSTNPRCIADSQGVRFNVNSGAEQEYQPAEGRESPLSYWEAGTSSSGRAGLAWTEPLTRRDCDWMAKDENTPVPRPSARSATAAKSTKNKGKRFPTCVSFMTEGQLFRHEAEARGLKKEAQAERRHVEKMVKLDSLMELLRANFNK